MQLSFNEGIKNFTHNLHDRYQVWNNQIVWQHAGEYHRVNGPAKNNQYFQKGQPHSLDSKSIFGNTSISYVNDFLHKINEPSETHDQNDAYYYLYGRLYACKGENQAFYKNGKLHRDDGPAFIWLDGLEEWYLNGLLHREDGPAVIYSDGTQEWYLNDELHREDGPAIIEANGTQEWYLNDELHREDGPAVTRENGTQEWYINGKLHRDDGPAVIHEYGGKEFWIHGEKKDF